MCAGWVSLRAALRAFISSAPARPFGVHSLPPRPTQRPCNARWPRRDLRGRWHFAVRSADYEEIEAVVAPHLVTRRYRCADTLDGGVACLDGEAFREAATLWEDLCKEGIRSRAGSAEEEEQRGTGQSAGSNPVDARSSMLIPAKPQDAYPPMVRRTLLAPPNPVSPSPMTRRPPRVASHILRPMLACSSYEIRPASGRASEVALTA